MSSKASKSSSPLRPPSPQSRQQPHFSIRVRISIAMLTLCLTLVLIYLQVTKGSFAFAYSWPHINWPTYNSACSNEPSNDFSRRARAVLASSPLIDGHNDLLISIRTQENGLINSKNFTDAFEHGTYPPHVDLPRLRKGMYGGAFWSAFYPCPLEYDTSFPTRSYDSIVRATFAQLDLFHRLAERYPHYFTLPTNASEGVAAWKQSGRLVSPLAIEGLHQIGNRLSVLRQYYALGVRYATLTWNCHNQYADAAVITFENNGTSVAAPAHWGGVSEGKGRQLIWEMNRLGMIVDIAHVSEKTMRDILVGSLDDAAHPPATGLDPLSPDPRTRSWKGSIAPPIFSHSSAHALCPHPRNVPDAVLQLVKQRNSLVMVNFSPDFISCTPPPANSTTGLPDFYPPNSTLHQVALHIVHIGAAIGYAHVGVGTDFDGIASTPKGLEDVSKMPDLVAELLRLGVSDADARRVVGENVARVWKEVEAVSRDLQRRGWVPAEDDLGELYDDL